MALVDVKLASDDSAVPHEVRVLVREAERRIELFQASSRVCGFVPSDFLRVYAALRCVAENRPQRGGLFCEWGSGFGVVACLAALLDFDACGIEIDAELVEASRQLAADFDLPVEFIRGSFIPKGSEVCRATSSEFSWLTVDADGAHEELGLAPDDFNVIFAYPWPDEESVTEQLFERYAAPGALLLTYQGDENLRLRRKGRRK